MSNRTGIKYPSVAPGTSEVNINNMYIKYTFVLADNNLARLLVLNVLGAVALPMAFALAVVALDPTLKTGCLGRSGNLLCRPSGAFPFYRGSSCQTS